MTALIIRLSSLGDVALSVPVIYSVMEQNTDITFSVLTKDKYAYLLHAIPGLKVISLPTHESQSIYNDIKNLFSRASISNYDMLFDLHGVLRSHLLTSLGWLKHKKVYQINKYRKEKKAIINGKNETPNPIPHIIDAYKNTFLRGGLSVDFMELPDHLFGLPDETILNFTKDDVKKVGIAPFAHHSQKIYPIDKMKEVIRILNNQGIAPFIFGGLSEKEEVMSWAKELTIHNCIDTFANIEEMRLIGQMDVMVCMDSANMHLSRLVGTPIITIWGATHPAMGFGGWKMTEDDYIQIPRESLSCRPCSIFGNKPCHRGDLACMNFISPSTIGAKILSRIET